MLRNLIAAIFLFALALPAMAMPVPAQPHGEEAMQDCHGAPMEHDKSDASDTHAQHRGCIGCIAPQIERPALFAVAAMSPMVQSSPNTKLEGTVPRPNLPPPRA